jgi:hypothetical protein
MDANPELQSDNHFDAGWQAYFNGDTCDCDSPTSFRNGFAAAAEYADDICEQRDDDMIGLCDDPVW